MTEHPPDWGAGPGRVATGIQGLDFVLGGGIPRSRLSLLAGAAGSGKTVVALQFLAAGVRSGIDSAVFVTFEEPPEQIRQTMRAFDWAIDEWERDGRWAMIDASIGVDGDGVEAGHSTSRVCWCASSTPWTGPAPNA